MLDISNCLNSPMPTTETELMSVSKYSTHWQPKCYI